MTVDDLRAIKDARQRALDAQGFMARGTAAVADARVVRDLAIVEWCRTSTQRQVAEALGVTPGLIGQIVSRLSGGAE